jgi:hypothetical protein
MRNYTRKDPDRLQKVVDKNVTEYGWQCYKSALTSHSSPTVLFTRIQLFEVTC